MQNNLQWQKADHMVALGQGCREGDGKDHEETYGGDRNVHYLDCGDDFTGVYLCQNSSNQILQTWEFYYISKKGEGEEEAEESSWSNRKNWA